MKIGTARFPQRKALTATLLLGMLCPCGPTIAATGGCTSVAENTGDDAILCFEGMRFLEAEATTSANASIGDIDSDGHLDIVLIRGRHWPVENRILFGDGSGAFPRSMTLSGPADRSYTGALADLDGDDDLDMVVSNDRPDSKLVYLNDGEGYLEVSSTFGDSRWKTRNITLADVNGDGMADIVVANRGPSQEASPNYLCLNDGTGSFPVCRVFSRESATTITPGDFNADGYMDLVVPHRDSGQSHVYLNSSTAGPVYESRPFGPGNASIRATAVADFDGDGLLDIVAIHTGSSEGGDGERGGSPGLRGTFVYYGLPGLCFTEPQSIGGFSRTPYALAVADLNDDGVMDILTGHVDATSSAYVNRGGRRFDRLDLEDGDGTTYGFAVGDLNEDGYVDIVMAKSGARSRLFFGAGSARP